MKDNLLQFLKNKTTTFTVEEVNQMTAIVNQLEEPKEETEPKKKK